MTLADGLQERLGLVAEHREKDEILLGRGEPGGRLAHVLGARGVFLDRRRLAAEELHRTAHRRLDRGGRRAVRARHELAELVEHGAVAPRRENVEEGLRAEDLTDRRSERWPARLLANPDDLRQRVQETVAGRVGPKMGVERRDEAGGKVVLRRPHRDAGRERGERLVADVLVDDVRGFPEPGDVDARVAPETEERLRERFPGDPMKRERERIDGRGDDVGPDARRDERVGERRACRGLDVQTDGKPARLLQSLDELLRDVRKERARRVVDEHTRGAQVSEAPRLLDERVGLAGAAGAVDEPDVQLATRADDRLAGLAEVRDVVQRVVQPEDLDPVLRRACDEPAHDVRRDRLRADEEPPAERDPERRRRACVDRADPLPGALDPASDRGVEDPAARDLEAAEAGTVEDLGDPQHLAGRHRARERLLREEPDRGVVELRHGGSLPPPAARYFGSGRFLLNPATRARCSAPRGGRP